MPKAKFNYQTAQILHSQGLSLTTISEQTDISYEALVKYAKRHRWLENRTQAVETLSANVQLDLQKQAKQHLAAISSLIEQSLTSLLSKKIAGLKISEVEGLARAAEILDRIARRSYGMDEQSESGPQTLVQIVMLTGHSGITVKQHPNTLDLECEPPRKPQP